MNLKSFCTVSIVIAVILTLLTAGCAPKPSPAVPAQTSAPAPAASADTTPAATKAPVVIPAPAITPEPAPASYAVVGYTIVREQGGDSTVIYDVTAHYPGDWDYRLENLVVEPEALYFTEGGEPKDGDYFESRYALVRLDFDGGGRMVLDSLEVVDYNQILPYGSRIFFIVDGFDAVGIGWAMRDGSASAEIDFTEYASLNGVNRFFNGAMLYIEQGSLYADVNFFTEDEEDIVEQTVRIGDDLSVERVSR